MHLFTKGLLSALELVGKGAKDQIWVLEQKRGTPFYISNSLSVKMHNSLSFLEKHSLLELSWKASF